MLKVGQRVHFHRQIFGHPYGGVVTKVYKNALVCHRRVTLYAVAWDGNPEMFPYSWADESTVKNRRGYYFSELKRWG